MVPAALLTLGCSVDAPEQAERAPAPLSQTSVREVFLMLKGPSAIEALPPSLSPSSAAAKDAARRRLDELAAQRARIVPELEAAGATVTADIRRVANAVQVLITESALREVLRHPDVVGSEPVPLFEPTMASALPIVGAPEVWAKSTPFDGDGIVIGIIDSGLDYTHADFGGSGDKTDFENNDQTTLEPGTFPTTKVIGGWDFVGNTYNPTSGNSSPSPDPDPLDCVMPQNFNITGGHGTHVAGIAAGTGVTLAGKSYTGSYSQSFDPAAFRIAPGVAPRAKLYALKIFGCQGGTTQLTAALDRAADPNQDGLFDDRLDVINASLGTSYALSSSVIGQAVQNLTNVGSLLVAAAGNAGPAFFAVSSPSTSRQTLSVAASADNELVALQVTDPPSVAGDYPAAEGGFTTRLADSGPINGPLVVAVPPLACGGISNASELAGKIALVDRGQCSFVSKFENAVDAGAIAVVVVDNEDDPLPFAMGGGDPGSAPIPGVMIRKSDGDKIKEALKSNSVVSALDAAVKFGGIGAEVMAGFSARGPNLQEDVVKPEISAPGFAIDSARVGSGFLARRSQGTSMASPVVAGAAALLRQARPTFSPLAVKAALVNSSDSVTDLDTAAYPVTVQGSGRVAVERAVERFVTAASSADGAVGVSFGSLVSLEPIEQTRQLTIDNHGTESVDFDVSVESFTPLPGVTVSATPASVSVGPGQSAVLTLTLALDPATLGAPPPDPTTAPTQYGQPRHYLNEASGRIVLSDTGTTGQSLTVPYYGSVRAAATRQAVAPKACEASVDGLVSLTLEGDSAHPEPVTTAFELGLLSTESPSPNQPVLDISAVGAATDLATRGFEEGSVYFGVAVAGEWDTVARGPISTVSVLVDNNQDFAPDFVVQAEALTKDGPYGDVLAATTYDVVTEQPTEQKRFLNMVSREDADSMPFYNSVVVFPVRLSNLGLTEGNTKLSYSVRTDSGSTFAQQGEQTDWISYDPENPRLDTGQGEMGRPMFLGDEPVDVKVAELQEGQEPAKLLVLHHANLAGQRHQVVELGPAGSTGNLSVSHDAPVDIGPNQHFLLTLDVSNAGAAAQDVKLTATPEGGDLIAAITTQGTCQVSGDTLSCALGDVTGAEPVTVTVELKSSDAKRVSLDAKVAGEFDCPSDASDDTTLASVVVSDRRSDAEGLSPSGGCGGCAVGENSDRRMALPLLGLLGIVLLRRRKR